MSRFITTLAIALSSAVQFALATPARMFDPAGSFPSLLDGTFES